MVRRDYRMFSVSLVKVILFPEHKGKEINTEQKKYLLRPMNNRGKMKPNALYSCLYPRDITEHLN